ncbi:Tyrosine-protein phosphatase non-receptor type 3-like [Scleropages formosus]|uniref:Tyrosine-protein phosphatase non-receptor type 3-like n=1 Tax=Scleropages formosus TaxID=113540 RepID=A0A0P7UYT1_SCLFO|nr:Tyrosine-protein phosphatase non-receptor type 3-like [Scleropages formosus]
MGSSSVAMNSRLPVFGGRISNAGSPELSKEKTKADAVCDVRFLDGTARSFKISKQDDGRSLLDAAFNHVGLPERELFGLQLAEEPADSARWLDPHKAVKKQFKGSAPWLLNFRVRFFIADPNSLQQEKTRHLYFLQIRSDIQSGRVPIIVKAAV